MERTELKMKENLFHDMSASRFKMSFAQKRHALSQIYSSTSGKHILQSIFCKETWFVIKKQ